MPQVSVVMPVYNGMPYLKEAVESLLTQRFTDFELVIVNDGSKDGSENFIKNVTDKRVRLVMNEQNLGLIASLNKGITHATGKYIARMDQDDIALPNRLEEQVKFMEAHPEVFVSGTSVNILGTSENKFPPSSD